MPTALSLNLPLSAASRSRCWEKYRLMAPEEDHSAGTETAPASEFPGGLAYHRDSREQTYRSEES